MGVHLITRAGSGIGATVAGLLAEHGEEPWLLARNEERAEALGTRFLRSRTVVADLAEPSVLVTALEKQGLPDRLDFLRHVAGVLEPGRRPDSTRRRGRRYWRSTGWRQDG
ncbi:hypothetical protein BOQ63_008100 [Streptomyces viridifaciens]|nr:hypothetical protein BOQ63_008100 [Streptomyces viridifaciens]